ncbi:hypothetical protein DCW30_04645 [Streptomyces alfalfae]|uniref:Secreted protein n=1 Tax=Streptomyces alfalfae TaxID=1642299 RepID=A0A1P8TL97_9ACTN|nr:hypothetical protein [Streptomyces alfalfae]AYA18780.1 hypothetical protein D3X13_23340 [Streptomyces fradiae]APY88375.1 hypothetical protein A7J05_24215 [Streptomyces alfalfae]QQC89250.1 hypothetical protein I8755_13100 [Streptomyces alfalfae]QUI31700.1 hypothetical protein H9W91_13135 [Streptomyces alfalfae]RXX46725.1 hypothetical protein DCW30_04645 [Streptomyces alfalfae]
MEAVGAIVALLVVLFLVAGIYATVKVAKAAKRGVDRTISEARRTVEDTTLRARSFAQVGSAAQLAQLRLSLRTSMRATQDVLRAGAVEDHSLKESLALFDRLSAHGHELDEELRRLERDPDKAALAERLPGLRERTEQITKAADSLRWVARDRARRFADDDLESLSNQIDLETGALRHWAKEPAPDQPPPAWPEPAAPAKGSEQTRPDASAASGPAAQEPQRPAINPPKPPVTYPWEKKAKPESTT